MSEVSRREVAPRKGCKYPWHDLKPGESFTVPLGSAESARRAGVLWCRKHKPGRTVVQRRAGARSRLSMVEWRYELTALGEDALERSHV